MNKHIFVINGSGGVGKDTFCNLVDKASNGRCYTYSSVNAVKQVAQLCGWNGAKEERDRKFLSDLKDLLTEYNDLPFKDICSQIESFLDASKLEILFIHIREPKEIQKLVDKYPQVKTILISSMRVDHIASNHADAEVFNYEYDYYIHNDGSLDCLKERAETFYHQLH